MRYLTFLMVSLVAQAVHAEVIFGPFVQYPENDPGMVTVAWETDEVDQSRLEFMVNEEEYWTYLSEPTFTTWHEMTFEVGPGEHFVYSIVGDSQVYTGQAQPLSCEEISFLVMGDTRNGHEAHNSVVAQMASVPHASFYLHSGDMVGSGSSQAQWDQFFDIQMPLMQRLPIVPAVGNHDGSRDNPALYPNRFVLPGNELYYSFQWGNIAVVTLDGHVSVDADGNFNEAQLEWLYAELERYDNDPLIDHIVIQTHVGPYGSAHGRSGSTAMRLLLDTFAEHGVSLIISGHDHLFEWGWTENDIPYIVSAGGGAPLYNPRSGLQSQGNIVEYVESVHHYVEVHVTGETLHFQAFDIYGERLMENWVTYDPQVGRFEGPAD